MLIICKRLSSLIVMKVLPGTPEPVNMTAPYSNKYWQGYHLAWYGLVPCMVCREVISGAATGLSIFETF